MNLKKIMYSLAVGAGLILGAGSIALGQGIQPAGSDAAAANGFDTNPTVSTSGVGVAGEGQDTQDGIISVIKNFLNWMLGILAFVAFAFLLYGGFTMVTAGGDENGYKKGFTVLKNAAIGLAFVGVAWLIITLIFFVIGFATGT